MAKSRWKKLGPLGRVWRVAGRWRYSVAIQFGWLSDRGYMICGAQRSGSSYLCEILASTGKLGRPQEYFNTPEFRRLDPKYPKAHRAQLDVVRSLGATRNGIYAVKVLGFQLERVRAEVDPLAELPNLKLIRMVRRDVIARAVSLARAKETGRFSSVHAAKIAPTYSTERIRSSLRSLHRQEEIWERALAPLGGPSLTVDYDELMADPQAIADQVAAVMGVQPVRVTPGLITLKVQRDSTSAEWRARFLAETGDEFRHLAQGS